MMASRRKRARGTTMANVLQPQNDTHQPQESLPQSQLEHALHPQLGNQPRNHSDTSSQPQAEHANSGNAYNIKRGRGPAQMPTEWGTKKKLEVQLDESNHLIGKDAIPMSTALGCLARNGVLAPLTYEKWTDMPNDTLEVLWEDVQANTTLPPEAKMPILKKIAILWRNWKSQVKTMYFEPNKDNEDYLSRVPDDRLELAQWKTLTAYWKQEHVQAIASKNKDNRAFQQFPHRTGRSSFGIVKEQMKSQGKDVGLLDVWIESRSRGKGITADEDTATVIAQFKEKLSQVPESERDSQYKEKIFVDRMGYDKHGRVRYSGKSVIPTKTVPTSTLDSLDKKREEIVQLVRQVVAQEKEDMQAKILDQIREEMAQERVHFQETMRAEFKECLEFINSIMSHVDSSMLKNIHIPAILTSHSSIGQGQDTSSSHKLHANSNGDVERQLEQEDQQCYEPDSPIPYELIYNANSGMPNDVFDFSPIKVGTRVYLLCYQLPKSTVAEGVVVSMDPNDEVGGVPLGPDFYKVYVKKVIDPDDYLMRPQRGVLTVGEAVNKCVAWHSSNVMEK